MLLQCARDPGGRRRRTRALRTAAASAHGRGHGGTSGGCCCGSGGRGGDGRRRRNGAKRKASIDHGGQRHSISTGRTASSLSLRGCAYIGGAAEESGALMFETGLDAIFVLRRRTGQPMVLRPKHPGGGGLKARLDKMMRVSIASALCRAPIWRLRPLPVHAQRWPISLHSPSLRDIIFPVNAHRWLFNTSPHVRAKR